MIQDCPVDCWEKDYDKEIATASYNRYFKKYKADGGEYGSMPPNPAFKINVPLKSGKAVTVEVRFKIQEEMDVTEKQVSEVKKRMEDGVKAHWNGKFVLTVDNPDCGSRSFNIVYQVLWVTASPHYTFKVHKSYPREGVTGKVVDLSLTTSAWVHAHEFGHCVGLPDEYSYTKDKTEQVKYINPDGGFSEDISAPFDGKSSADADATIMAAFNNTNTLPRHAWNIAIEVQELLRAKLGRKVKCTIS